MGRENWLLAAMLAAAACSPVWAQWDLEESRTTASLRGIASVGGGVAWASGTNGTVLRTEDGGYLWQSCMTPPGAEKLDFRGIQAFDANTAVVMSSGKGELSRIYETTDGCATWKLIYTNPDKEGFWDALSVADRKTWMIFGDPVGGVFQVLETSDGGAHWDHEQTQPSLEKEGAFAASNSSLAVDWAEDRAYFGTGSPTGARLFSDCGSCSDKRKGWAAKPMPLFAKGESAGIFAIGYADWQHWIAVGGDYQQPDASVGNAAWSTDAGNTWHAPVTGPHGYRSAVDYDAKARVWITVGPNGTDVSRDGGRSWQAVHPGPGEPADADKEWNALSLPFVVGPKGHIGKWRGLAEAHGAQPKP